MRLSPLTFPAPGPFHHRDRRASTAPAVRTRRPDRLPRPARRARDRGAGDDGAYRRSLRLAGGPATVELRPGDGVVQARFELARTADRPEAEAAARALLDLDADPGAIVAALGDDALIGPLVRANPGLRLPGHPDPAELADPSGDRPAGLGELPRGRSPAGSSPPTASRSRGRSAASPTCFPTPAALARLGDDALPMPRSRARALTGLAGGAGRAASSSSTAPTRPRPAPAARPARDRPVDGDLRRDAGARQPRRLPRHRSRRSPRARAASALDGSPRAAEELAERWRPYRAYALQHLWTTLD